MKVKLTEDEIKKLASSGKIDARASDPWWVIALKALAYIIGLVLAGYATPAVTSDLFASAGAILNLF